MIAKPSNKLQLLLVGSPATPRLFMALQIAQGLCGSNWDRIIVVGPTPSIGQYQYLGDYTTLTMPRDAVPSRYTELLNVASSCGKEVVIFSDLSSEWQYGVCDHLGSSYYEDVLRTHRTLLTSIRQAPVHVIACLATRKTFLQRDEDGRRKFSMEQIIQQPGIEQQFMTVLRLDRKSNLQALKDELDIFDMEIPFRLSAGHEHQLRELFRPGEPAIPLELQLQIDSCTSLAELYQVLFDCDLDDLNVLSAFTRKKLDLMQQHQGPVLQPVIGSGGPL